MPQRHVVQRRLRVRAHHTRQPADLLAAHRIALVRHGRAAALPGGERLFRLTHFGALEVADFESDLFERGGHYGQRADVLRVAVAADHL